MYRLVNDYELNADDPLWDDMTHATDEKDLRQIVMASWGKRPRAGLRDAMTVGLFGLANAFEVPEEYEQDEPEPDAEETEDVPDEEAVDEPAEELPEPEAKPNSNRWWKSVPDWLPRPDWEGPQLDVEAMQDILTDMPKAAGFEGFDGGHPIFSELRRAKDINDAYTIILRNGVPRIMVKKFLRVTRAIFDHDGRDPDTGERIREWVRRRLVTMMEDAVDDACEDDPVPDPSKRGPTGVSRLLPMYGMDEGPNTEPIDFAPKSGLAKIMRLSKRDRG
jgi:hypothetical protein